MRIRQLKLEVTTQRGPFRTDIEFPPGLVVVRADNTSGKSTCLKSMVYALGLERVFGPGSRPPLPPAMMSLIEVEKGKDEVHVLESQVFLELENRSGEIITIQRKAVTGSPEQDWRLVVVHEGPLLSQPSDRYHHRSFFARDPGSASREGGFQHYLASFLGWKMPEVTHYNGTPTPLYMEAILPLFYIEQSNGWSSIQANTPRYFQIRDIEKRAIEFILKLDTFEREERMQRVLREETAIRTEWEELSNHSRAAAASRGCTIRGLSAGPQLTWPPEPAPIVECFDDQKWRAVPDVLSDLRAKISQLTAQPVATVGASAASIEIKLVSLQKSADERASLVDELVQFVQTDRASVRDVQERLKALEEDLHRNQDIVKLRSYGAPGLTHIDKSICPTCTQPVSDTLLPQDISEVPMTVDENIELIKSQISLFRKMKSSIEKRLADREQMLIALRKELNSVFEQIRTAKQALVSDNRTPSALQIREQIDLERRVSELLQAQNAFDDYIGRFSDLASQWRDVQDRKRTLGDKILSPLDFSKLSRLRELMISQLKDYKFHSFPPENIQIQPENYRPARDKFDLIYDISASDNIRVIASFAISMMELAKEFPTNHPDILILDEPRQQSLSKVSFREIFERLSHCASRGQQVIIATSEARDSLNELMKGLPAKIVSFPANILQLERSAI